MGAIVFGGFIGLGLLLVDRVSSGLPVVILGAAGAYAGWLVGVIVFGAVRGDEGAPPSDPRISGEERN